MKWLLGALILLLIGFLLRRVLRMGSPRTQPHSWLAPLPAELHTIYHPVVQEVETHMAILGISLNDAFEEREAQRHDQAWHMMRISTYEWDRVAELMGSLLDILTRHLADAVTLVPPHSVSSHWFKTRVMIDYVRMHELMDQLVFNSKLRFQLQLRLLRRATATLTGEYRRAFRNAERIQDPSEEVWTQFDHFFHDFDLVAKETLLAFRALLLCLNPSRLQDVAADAQEAIKRGVRSASGLPK